MKKDIKKEVIKRIEKEDIKIHPKSFFKALKLFAGMVLIFLGILAIYLFNLSFYLPRRGIALGRPIAHLGALSFIPWPLVILGTIIIGVMIYIYTKYEGGYKKNLLWTAIVIAVLIIAVGAAISVTRLNEKMESRPRFRQMYDWHEGNFVPGGRRRLEQRSLPFNRTEKNLKYFN